MSADSSSGSARVKLLRRVGDGLSIAIVLVAVVVFGGRLVRGSTDVRTKRDANEAYNETDDRQRRSLELEEFVEVVSTGRFIGARDGPVVLLVYNDYACGFCAQLHQTLQTLQRRYPAHLGIVIKQFTEPSPLGRYRVALGAECAADQGKFSEYHSAVFANTRMLDYTSGWRMLADSAGVPDPREFRKCVDSRRYAARIAEHHAEGKSLGVTVTPTLFINGNMVVGAPPLESLDSLIALQFPGRGDVRTPPQDDRGF
jgi:predicted DsbA family dithiol-disulfide isomerase